MRRIFAACVTSYFPAFLLLVQMRTEKRGFRGSSSQVSGTVWSESASCKGLYIYIYMKIFYHLSTRQCQYFFFSLSLTIEAYLHKDMNCTCKISSEAATIWFAYPWTAITIRSWMFNKRKGSERRWQNQIQHSETAPWLNWILDCLFIIHRSLVTAFLGRRDQIPSQSTP